LGLALIVGPNLLDYGRIAELEAPDQVSALSDTFAAVTALEQRGLRTGYADYWTAYPLTYLSGEQLIVAPSLPFFWSRRVDRYPRYTEQVDAVSDPAGLFLLVDRHCSNASYLAALDAADASYRVEMIARWVLVWDIRTPVGTESETLTGLRAAIAAQETC
jgi:hypothetical protein